MKGHIKGLSELSQYLRIQSPTFSNLFLFLKLTKEFHSKNVEGSPQNVISPALPLHVWQVKHSTWLYSDVFSTGGTEAQLFHYTKTLQGFT